ncbi:HEAT repeat containing 1 homolog l(2)k09022 isoform X2 [Lycorma delicatula]|uniref:HEAT repeat containing 1 homolog l(2)k09022 isoform X2 n=1 Tax=Lycorma delicatula TaxID=130591 RepID=UPI003F5125B1
MPETSLSQQLKQLSAPQTSQLVDKTWRPSLLFNVKEAANIDRDTFYSIGLKGLEELESIDSHFEHYEKTLFDPTAVHLARSVETLETNKKLDKEISNFLIHCTPYLLLKPTHNALEWLIYRFQIQSYNTDSLMMLALPYYETTTFAQVIQLLSTKKNEKWAWLESVKKHGTPLSKTALLNRAATDISFFKFVCNMPILVTEVYEGEDAKCLASLFTFYCTTVIGAFEHCGTISELHISHLLPSLIAGLSSKIKDFIASSFMILSCLVAKVQLNRNVLETLFYKVVKVRTMKSEAILLMVILCQCNNAVSEKSLAVLMKSKWFKKSLISTIQAGVSVFPLVISILSSCIDVIKHQKGDTVNEIKSYVSDILHKMCFSVEEAEIVFRIFVDSCTSITVKKNLSLRNWFVVLMKKLEKQYPQSFDSIISDNKYSSVAKELMGLSPDYEGQSELFEKLHHPNANVRIEAVKAVPEQLQPIESSWLSETILERLSDDEPRVVKAVLSQPSDYLQSLIGSEKLRVSLTCLAIKIWKKNEEIWYKLAPAVLTKLSKSLQADYNELNLLLTVVPFLFINEPYHLQAAKNVLSVFSQYSFFLKAVGQKIKKVKNLSKEELQKTLWEALQDSSCLTVQIDDAVIHSNTSSSSIDKFIIILFSTAKLSIKSNPLQSLNLINLLGGLIKESELIYENPKKLNATTLNEISGHCRKGKLPLQIFQYFLFTVINKTDIRLNQTSYWWDMKEPSQDFLYIVLKHSLAIRNLSNDQCFIAFFKKITQVLQEQEYFKKSEDYCKFLCNVIVRSPALSLDCFSELESHLQNIKKIKDFNWTVELSSTNILLPTLLIGLSSPVEEARHLALEIMADINSHLSNIYPPFVDFVKELILWDEEISCDSNQACVAMYMLLSPDPDVQSCHSPSLRQAMDKVCEVLFSIVTDSTTPTHVVASLLQLLAYVNSVEILKKLVPLATDILDLQNISEDQKSIVESVVNRIDPSIVSIFEDDDIWSLAEKCMKLHDGRILIGADKITPAVLFLKKITHEIFDGLSENGKQKMIDLVLTMNASSENGEANIAVIGMVKKIVLDASCVIPILCSMRDVKVVPPENQQRPRKRWLHLPSINLLKTVEWQKGISLLELIQDKKKLTNVQQLVSPLFDVLKRCLEFEEQSPVEYAKQLLLATILHVCQKLSGEDKLKDIPKHIIQVELIVQCIRASQNPQTHHHAMLVLVEIAAFVPDKVLHDIMPIFTFVGSSVLRMDDAYSFQIILKIIETVIPILVQNVKKKEDTFSVQQVLQVFVDALLDIPEHRRLTLLLKLITTLDNDGGYLWLFICLVAQSEVLSSELPKPHTESAARRDSKLKILKNLCLEFSSIILIKTMYSVINHVASLPTDKEGKSSNKKRKSIHSVIFDVEKNSGKPLRHYKYILINFISLLLSTPRFIDMLLAENDKDIDENIVLTFKQLVHEVMDYLHAVSVQVNRSVGQPSLKYWKAMQHLLEEMNSKISAVLPNTIFLNMMRSILSVESPPKIQRKMLEILNWRLQSTALNKDGLVSLVPPLLNIMNSDISSSSTDIQITQQAAFISLKLLARQVASEYSAEFEKALAHVTKLVQIGLKSDTKENYPIVLASAVLCLAELVSTLGSKAIRFLPKFMPAIIQTVSKARSDPDLPEVLLMSVVTTVQKVLEHHTNFINPYLENLLIELCLISSSFEVSNAEKSGRICLKN